MGEAYAAKLDKAVYTDPIMEKFAEVTGGPLVEPVELGPVLKDLRA